MKVSIIIPNYNGKELLNKNLPYVFDAARYFSQKTNSEVEIIIVDDASSDKSVVFIKSQQKQVRLLENEKNLGFSSTVNKGVKEATGDIVVLLNTDVVPERIFLEPLLAHFSDESVFAVGCMDKSIEGSKTVLRGRGLGRWERGFLVHGRGEVDKTNTLWVNGGSGAFRKSIWEKLGGFNELYNPFYWEDIDLSYRALKLGYVVLFEPKSIVVHEHKKGAIKARYSDFKIKSLAYKNQFIFVWLNITDVDLFVQHILWFPYLILRACIKNDLAFLLGFIQLLAVLPVIFRCRLQMKQDFILSDREIMQKINK